MPPEKSDKCSSPTGYNTIAQVDATRSDRTGLEYELETSQERSYKSMKEMNQNGVDQHHAPKDSEQEFSIQWKIILLAASIYTAMFASGFGYSLSVLYAELLRFFRVDRATVALVQSLNRGFVIGSTILWSYPIKLFGPGRCTLLASIVFCVAILVSAFSVNIEMVICLIGIVAGLSGSLLYLGPYFIISKIFNKQRTTFLSFLTCGISLGQIVLTFSLELLIHIYGWRGALLIMSALAMNTVPCCLLLHVKTASIEGSMDNTDHNKLFKPHLFKYWRFVLLMFNAFIYEMAVLPESLFLVDFTVLKGFDVETGSMFASLMGVTNMLGRFIGIFINSINTGKGSLCFACITLLSVGTHMLVLVSVDFYGLLIGTLFSGLSFGLSRSQIVVTILDIFPLDHFPAVLAMWYMVGGLGFTFGGYIGGTVSDMTGSYDLLFEMSAAGCVLSFSCMIILYLSLVVEKKQKEYESL